MTQAKKTVGKETKLSCTQLSANE